MNSIKVIVNCQAARRVVGSVALVIALGWSNALLAQGLPQYISFSPTAGPVGTVITVTGTGLAAVRAAWMGAAHDVGIANIGATQVKLTVPRDAVVGLAQLKINTAVGWGYSSTYFKVTAASSNNPNPTIAALTPASITAGAASFTLLVNGSNFVPSSAVHWGSGSLATTYVNKSQIRAVVPAMNIARPTRALVNVINSATGKGTANSASFTISSAVTSGPKLAQFNSYQTINANGENYSTLQFKSPTKAGATIWVAVTVSDYAGAHTISVTDSQGNVYKKLNQENDGAPGTQSIAHFYAANIPGDSSTPDTVTVVWGWDDYKGVLITEIVGATSASLVGYSGNIQNGLGAGFNNVTTAGIAVSAAQTPALMLALSMNTFGGLSNTGGSGFPGPTTGAGFTQQALLWNWGLPLATFETMNISTAGIVAPHFSALDKDYYVTEVAVFH